MVRFFLIKNKTKKSVWANLEILSRKTSISWRPSSNKDKNNDKKHKILLDGASTSFKCDCEEADKRFVSY